MHNRTDTISICASEFEHPGVPYLTWHHGYAIEMTFINKGFSDEAEGFPQASLDSTQLKIDLSI